MRVVAAVSRSAGNTPVHGCKKTEESGVRGRKTLQSLSKQIKYVLQFDIAQVPGPVRTCLAAATVMALHCPQAISADVGSFTLGDSSHTCSPETTALNQLSGDVNTALGSQGLRDGPHMQAADGARQGVTPFVTDLADAPALPASAYPPDAMVTGTYVPGPVEVGWQIYVGSAVAAFPFVLGAYEFGKRILIQRRCEKCGGNGLIKKGKFYRKCSECGGFFPWQGWKLFFTSTASPGNGGPLLQPRGQTSVLYKVPPKPKESRENEAAAATSANTRSRDSLSGGGGGDGSNL